MYPIQLYKKVQAEQIILAMNVAQNVCVLDIM